MSFVDVVIPVTAVVVGTTLFILELSLPLHSDDRIGQQRGAESVLLAILKAGAVCRFYFDSAVVLCRRYSLWFWFLSCFVYVVITWCRFCFLAGLPRGQGMVSRGHGGSLPAACGRHAAFAQRPR